MFLNTGVTKFKYGPKGDPLYSNHYDADYEPPSTSAIYSFAIGDLWTLGSRARYYMGGAWSLYDPNITDVKQMQRHPGMPKYRLTKNKSGSLTWMTPDSMRSVRNKRKREVSDDEVSNVISERLTTNFMLYV